MRTTQSSTASRLIGSPLLPLSLPGLPRRPQRGPAGPQSVSPRALSPERAGLLHDASNLISALGLYCDLLAMPAVLKPEHRHYAEEMRLLGTRSAALIERLMDQRGELGGPHSSASPRRSVPAEGSAAEDFAAEDSAAEDSAAQASASPDRDPAGVVCLREVVEGCAGLLRRVAAERPIRICYGAAVDMPVRVSAEAVERILVNLVRNATGALQDSAGSAAIRIQVGARVSHATGSRCWPSRSVRLRVEDSGCGMGARQVDRLLHGCAPASAARHGIGFHVVRRLVQASRGNLAVVSSPGRGTRVEIQWPLAPPLPVSRSESRLPAPRSSLTNRPSMTGLSSLTGLPNLSKRPVASASWTAPPRAGRSPSSVRLTRDREVNR